uniref:G domain-containing protein n=1 Tax=Panagrolaimus superbus TaxID=310955 RepID=A0A914YRT0_9BILA
MSLKTVKFFDHEVENLATPFDTNEQYFIYLKPESKTEPPEKSTVEKLKNFAVHEMPPDTVPRNPRNATMISIGDEVVKNRIQIPQGQKITRQALGDIADFGAMYDAHTDTFCSRSLFNGKIPPDCIKPTDTHGTTAEFALKDSITEKLDILNIEAGLQASFLAGLVKIKGHGKYLSTTKTSARQSSGSLICNMSTKFESINVDTQDIVSLISPESVKSTPNATHVVVGIHWGAVATSTLTYMNTESIDKKEIDAALEVKLKFIKSAGAGLGTYVDDNSVSSTNFRLDFYMDALPSGDRLPKTVEESIEFMRKMPDLIKNANQGRGTPIFYELLPLSAFQTYLNSIGTLDSLIHKVDETAVKQLVGMMENINESQQLLNDLHTDMKESMHCLKDEDITAITDCLSRLHGYHIKTKERINRVLVDIRYGRSDMQNKENLGENKTLFYSLMNAKNVKCFLGDLSVNPQLAQSENVPPGNRICHFDNGQYINIDVVAEHKRQKSLCLAKCIESRQFLTTKPNKRVILELPCPRSIGTQKCSNAEKEWFCADCHKTLEYSFDEKFICDCGSAPANTFLFRCSSDTHGSDFIGFKDENLIKLLKKIRPYKQTNILILGETGVGKSTWINGFANYLTYSTLEEGENSPQICLIPAKFNFRDREIKIGESKNECSEVGASCTQEPRSHVFNVGKKTIRLIDTPGIGDNRGLLKDSENFASILRYISHIDEIHGICILLKPNNSRITIMFKYCLNELLTHLHKSAANNIVFCFTNARSTFYEPGDTKPTLEKHLKSLNQDRGVKIELAPPTTYCMDNEAFRFLCCIHAGETSVISKRESYSESWNISVKETLRLFKHFEEITPHVVKDTVSLNETRQFILTLAKPLADVTKNVQDNINQINAKRNEIEALDSRSQDLKKQLKIPHRQITTEPLGFPRTVCVNDSCIETQRDPITNSSQVLYKTICHDHCYLDNVTPEQFPNPDLQKCQAMNSQLSCKRCGCSWNVHIHITFEQGTETIMVDDPHTQQLLNDNQSELIVKEEFIKTLNLRVEQYTKEQKIIDDVCTQFGAFLKLHAMLPYNDAVEEYLKYNIEEEKRIFTATKDESIKEKIELLQDQLAAYQEKKRILDENLENNTAKVATISDIRKWETIITNLPLTGKEIKKLIDATKKGKEVNFQYKEDHFNPAQYIPSTRHYLNVNTDFQSGSMRNHNVPSAPFYKRWNPIRMFFGKKN